MSENLTLKAGDIVILKSGGPSMTIEWIESKTASCSWFDGKKLENSRFSVASLEIVK